MKPKTTDKRIVSKGEYMRVQINRYVGWLRFLGSFLFCIALFYLLISGFGRNLGLGHVIRELVLIVVACIMYHVSKFHLRHTLAIKPVVAFTRANTADLPAPDTLVRASAEPVQAQETVLLRAATEGQETPPEQLVRAVNGRE